MDRTRRKEAYPHRKISETLLDFASPILSPFWDNASEQEMEAALKIAFTVRNAMVFDAVNCNDEWLERLRDEAAHDPQTRMLLEQLAARKQRLFHDDHRLIGEYQLFRKDGELRLRAEARRPAKAK